ncbi:MAG: hypothetical protein U0324_15235 [Polyangiales bacterium]
MRELTDKTGHLGRAGQLAVMAELLARGWNVAIPEVDVGDDVFVAKDDGTRLTRVQVKTATPVDVGGAAVATFLIPPEQLMKAEEVPLVYVFAVPTDARWRFVVVARRDLSVARADMEASPRAGQPGRPPSRSGSAVSLALRFEATGVSGWGRSFAMWESDWSAFPVLRRAVTPDARA